MSLKFEDYGKKVTFVVNGTLKKGEITSFPFNGVVDIKEDSTEVVFSSVREEDIKFS